MHARTVECDLIEAKKRYAPRAKCDPLDVALFTQGAIQGAFILAKAQDEPEAATRAIAHLRVYIATLLPKEKRKLAARKLRA